MKSSTETPERKKNLPFGRHSSLHGETTVVRMPAFKKPLILSKSMGLPT